MNNEKALKQIEKLVDVASDQESAMIELAPILQTIDALHDNPENVQTISALIGLAIDKFNLTKSANQRIYDRAYKARDHITKGETK